IHIHDDTTKRNENDHCPLQGMPCVLEGSSKLEKLNNLDQQPNRNNDAYAETNMEKARNKEKSKIEQWAKEKNIGDRCNWLNMELVFRNQQAGLRIIGKMRIGAF
ncbi:hypothetical protein BB559_005275, partial [Furculomyces boomerangus]